MPAQTVTKVLSAQSGTVSSAAVDYGGVQRCHTLTVVAGAGVSAGVVNLELSNDGGATWATEASNTVTLAAPGQSSVHLVDKLYSTARARISTGITGGVVDVYIAAGQ
jgi:hypothetical protein